MTNLNQQTFNNLNWLRPKRKLVGLVWNSKSSKYILQEEGS